jgi:hypothetical protein
MLSVFVVFLRKYGVTEVTPFLYYGEIIQAS